ncbi:hypothetical protein H8E50_12680 [bacterium]|nr:hypothetical protein [bacterium]
MITEGDIKSIMKKDTDEKDALLKDILNWAVKVEPVFEGKKTEVKALEEESITAEENVIKLLNGHIRRLESEKAELNMEMQEIREEWEQSKKIKDEITFLADELEKTRAVAETALKEKADADEKLIKIQEQWEKIIG